MKIYEKPMMSVCSFKSEDIMAESTIDASALTGEAAATAVAEIKGLNLYDSVGVFEW